MKKKKKVSKNKRKFFIILSCYVAVFIITCITTVATLAWFNSSTWSSEVLYMGGPVYLYFSDSSGVKETSKAGNLSMSTPPGWDYLYPGMNLHLGARAVVQGAEFKRVDNDKTTVYYMTGAILRARVMITVVDPDGHFSQVAKEVYDNVWAQVKARLKDEIAGNEGEWVFDKDYNYKTYAEGETAQEEDHFFYYVKKNQTFSDAGKYELLDVGGTKDNVSVGFLDDAVLTLSGKELTNIHAECVITFTIVFHGLQAFLPYTNDDIGTNYQGDTTGRSPLVLLSDVGDPKPLTVENSRGYFREAFSDIYGPNDIY